MIMINFVVTNSSCDNINDYVTDLHQTVGNAQKGDGLEMMQYYH